MNGIEKITDKLLTEAREEAKTILDDAKARCGTINAEYEQKAAEAYRAAMDQGMKLLKAGAERREGSLAMQTRKELLALKQEMVTEAFTVAADKIAHLPQNEYVTFLAGLAADAAQSGCGEIIMNSNDAKAVGGTVIAEANGLLKKRGMSADLRLSRETREIGAGLILKNKDIEVNCTVDTMLSLCRDEMASQVAATLFS